MFRLFIIFITLLNTSFTKGVTVQEIIKRANLASYYQANDGKSHVKMKIVDSQKRVRKREFVILRRNIKKGGDQQYYVYFSRPTDVRKMVFLVHKHIKKDDDRWLYLPALDLVKRIAATDKRTSFVGSDFLYEDVSGRGIKADHHTLLKEDEKYYIISSTPKNQKSVEFSKYMLWIDKKSFLPMKTEYFDKSGKKYRLVEALEVKDFNGFLTITKSKVHNLDTGGFTELEFHKVKYNLKIKSKVFTERYLRRTPKEVRR
ncbi:MAG: outer membrane lipoprotein-sorting protein [Candidatus Cloacimonadota bacterium]|nr:MAG: outer membrane lipoprotein-sorting protein [Candidatus Cloacimonadota bacterium]